MLHTVLVLYFQLEHILLNVEILVLIFLRRRTCMTNVNTGYSEDLAPQVYLLWTLLGFVAYPAFTGSPAVAAYGLQLVMLAPSTPHTSSQEN